MIVCKYTKLGAAAYMPHLDLLRAFGMALRRAGLSIAFSEGFNPHARLFFTQPLPIGTKSICEYFCADSTESAEHFMSELNATLPNGIKILNAANIEANPNLANMMNRADYEIELADICEYDFSVFCADKEIIIQYESKGKLIEKDVRDLVYNISSAKSKILLTVACGNLNLRADRLAKHLLQKAQYTKDFSVTKTAVYNKDIKDLTDIFFN